MKKEDNMKKPINVVERTLDEEIRLHIKASDPLPLVLVGGTGIGKTSRIISIAESMGAKVYVIHLSQAEDVGDVLGFAVRVNDEVKWKSLPMWEEILERQKKGLKSVIFLDEYNRAKPVLTHSVFQLLAEWRVKDFKFDPQFVRIFGAINPSGEYAVREDDLAWKARVCYYIVDSIEVESWLEYMEGTGLMDNTLKKFFRENPNLLSTVMDFDSEPYQGIPTPRTWERAIRAEREREGISLKMLIGLVGRTAALALINFKPKLPSFQEVVKNPHLLAEFQEDAITILEGGIRKDDGGVKEEEFMAIFKFLKDYNREILMAWINSIWKHNPEWKCTHPEFEEWVASILGIPPDEVPKLKKLLENIK